MHVCLYMRAYVFVHGLMYVRTYLSVYVYMYEVISALRSSGGDKHVYVRVDMRMYIHSYVYTHVYSRAPLRGLLGF